MNQSSSSIVQSTNKSIELPVIDRLFEEHQLLKWLMDSQPVTWVIGGDGDGKKTLVSKVISQERFHQTTIIRAAGVNDTYGLWKQVAEQTVAQMYKLNQDEFSRWVAQLNLLPKGDLEAIIMLVPSLKKLIKQKVARVTGNEKHLFLRVTQTLTNFLKTTFTSPTIIILEDIHLADRQSLDYLALLLQENSHQNTQLIVIYNPENLIIRQFKEEAIVHLKPLSLEELTTFVQPMLTQNLAINAIVVSYLYEQTSGNISKINELLYEWYEQKLLVQDPQTNEWIIYADEIAQLIPVEASDTLQLYMKNNQFKSMNNEVLIVAAVLKTIFDAQLISLILKQDMKSIEKVLEDAVQKKIIKKELHNTNCYSFSNDNIWKEWLKQFSQSELRKYHFDISFVLENYCSTSTNYTIRDVLYHANESHQFFNTPSLQERLAKWYVRGALQEKLEGNISNYFKYVESAKQLVSLDFQKYSSVSIFVVYEEWAKCLFIQKRWEESEALLLGLIEYTSQPLQKANLYLQMMQIYSEQNNKQKLLATYTMLKDLIGIKMNDRMSRYELLFRWFKLHLKLKDKLDLQYFSSFESPKREVVILMQALYILSVNCYKNARPEWFKWILLMNELTVKHGIVEVSSHSLTGYAIVLNMVFKDYDAAYKWSYFALNIVDENAELYIHAKTLFMICNDSWRKFEPNYLNVTVEDLHNRKQMNDLWFAKHHLFVRCSFLFQYSYPLADIQILLQEECKALGILESDVFWKQAVILDQLITNLTGISSKNNIFVETIFEEDNVESLTIDEKNFLQEFRNMNDYICHYIFGNYSTAWIAVNECYKNYENSKGTILSEASHNYYYLLLVKEVYDRLSDDEKKTAYKKAKKCKSKLKKMSETSPENYLHKFYIAKAVLANVRNGDENIFLSEMKNAYTCAIKYKQIHDAAIILENIARYYLGKGQQLEAKIYLVEACEYYSKWGALKKVQQLEKDYKQLLFPLYREQLEREEYVAIVKSAQALSQEIELSRLLQQLLRIMLQQADAHYGALIFGSKIFVGVSIQFHAQKKHKLTLFYILELLRNK